MALSSRPGWPERATAVVSAEIVGVVLTATVDV